MSERVDGGVRAEGEREGESGLSERERSKKGEEEGERGMGDIEERGGRKSGLRECGEKESRVNEWGKRWGVI